MSNDLAMGKSKNEVMDNVTEAVMMLKRKYRNG